MRTKALEWVKHPHANLWRADCLTGRYQVYAITSPITWGFDGFDGLTEVFGESPTEEAAKAAAQSHFDAAIASVLEDDAPTATDDDDEMVKISALIARMQDTLNRFGDTCVYIRRGGLSWGAVALNRRDDDKKHGVFDLQATHDREMDERVEQINRLITDRNEWRDRAWAAEKANPSPPKAGE
jgi:hypothetical protein